MLVQYVESESAWTPTAKKGATNGGVAASEAERIGVPWGVTIWCDLQGVAVGTPRQQVIDYSNRWHNAVSGAGYVPGLYDITRGSIRPSSTLSCVSPMVERV